MNVFGNTIGDAWVWLGASLFLAVFWSNIAWAFLPWVERDRSAGDFGSREERIVRKLATWHFAPVLLRVARLAYYVGLPFAALFWGRDALISRFFGLQPLVIPTSGGAPYGPLLTANWLNWLHDFGWAAALGLASAGLLLLAAWTHRRALPRTEVADTRTKTSGWDAIREAAYHEIHWAFYRNAPIAAFGLYWGIWAGLALSALEALANPRWRADLTDPRTSARHLLRASLAVVSSLLFLYTQNLWLAIVLHSAVSWSLQGAYGASLRTIPERMVIED